MVQTTRFRWWLLGLAVVAGLIALVVFFARPADPQRMSKWMQSQIAQLRGLQFKRDVVIQEQSQGEFRKQADNLMQRLSAPENEQLLRTLGLLASDETLDPDALGKHVETGPSGQYDPYSGRVLVVKASTSQPRQGKVLDEIYAREFYRALLDQHFDLKKYLERGQRDGALNNDELLARQIVVEAEAAYGALVWGVKQEMGQVPKYLPLALALDRKFKNEEIIGLMNDPRLPHAQSSRRQPRREPGGLPTNLTELIKAMQREGLLFAEEVRQRGWKEFDKLYTTSPPASTEQILHPRKWFVGERPMKIEWPAFETHAAFADWELVEQDVFGELLLRTVFRVYQLSPMMGSAPAGWNGDRYAVLKRRDSGDMLLLMYTVWDEERDATAFAEAYRVVVTEKYAEVSQPVRILEEGRRVVIVEGGEASSLDAFMAFAKSAREIENTTVEK